MHKNLFVFLEPVDEPRPTYACCLVLKFFTTRAFFILGTAALSVLTLPIKTIGGNLLSLFTLQTAPPYGVKVQVLPTIKIIGDK